MDQKEHGYIEVEAYKVRGYSQSYEMRSRRKSRRGAKLGKNECVLEERLSNIEEKWEGKTVFDTCVVEYGDESSDFAMVGKPITSYSNEEWILDSGCTYHRCPNMEWFFNYEEQNGGVVFMGSNSPCKTIGIDQFVQRIMMINQNLEKCSMRIKFVKEFHLIGSFRI